MQPLVSRDRTPALRPKYATGVGADCHRNVITMKQNDLKKAAAKAQEGLRLAETEAAELHRNAKTTKAIAEQARLEHKRARKAAKQAKRLAQAADEHARGQRRAWEKAQKRLAKAMKKLAKAKGRAPKQVAKAAKAAEAPLKPGSSTMMARAQMPAAPKAPAASVGSQSPPVTPGAETTNPASPAV